VNAATGASQPVLLQLPHSPLRALENRFHFRRFRLIKKPDKAKMAHGVHTVSNSKRTNLSAHHNEKRGGFHQLNPEDMKEGQGKIKRVSSKGQKIGTPK